MSDLNTVNTSIASPLRAIPGTEKFKAQESIDAEAMTATVVFGIRLSEGETRYEMRSVLDFSGCSTRDLIALALYDVKVRLQARLRDMGKDMVAQGGARFGSVHVLDELINGTRAPVDPVAKFKRDAARLGFSEADVAEMLAKMPQASPAA